jgi:alkanesulfonate monooxygenase SsuD/methylene tetrahydromethanopterin reductase-like flavin-dependent oxidoreductase (luciferase family)
MLGHLAARNRVGRLRLGVGVTDAGRRNPAVTAQAAEWRDHGLRYAVLVNLSLLQPSLRKGVGASLPFTKILGGLKKL